MNERAERSDSSSHQLVLIGRHGREDCFRKDEGSVFLILHVTNWAALPFCSLHKVNPGLELVHRVQDDLKQRKLCNLSDRLSRAVVETGEFQLDLMCSQIRLAGA